jgi:hypothetical protein
MKERNSRQSFLGSDLERLLGEVRLGIVGLGGGGSQVVQQLAHVGFLNYVVADPDVVEESNLTRLVGATVQDAKDAVLKVVVTQRLIASLQPSAKVEVIVARWQEMPEALRNCHFIIGCVDTFAGRRELEAFARRHMAIYIDLGMDVWKGKDGRPVMGGQVCVSLPGKPCMHCLGILTEENLAKEALEYGAAGGRPQVVWANGILASVAVGRIVDLVTNWTQTQDGPLCWSFDGNRLHVAEHWRSRALDNQICQHYPPEQVGHPTFDSL